MKFNFQKLVLQSKEKINHMIDFSLKRINKIFKDIEKKVITLKYDYLYLKLYEKLYLFGLLLSFSIVLPLLIIAGTDKNNQFFSFLDGSKPAIYYLNISFSWLVVSIIAIGYVIESFEKLGKLLARYKGTNTYKIIVPTIFFLVYIISELLIGHYINNLTELDPSHFGDGKIALKIIFIPLSWFILFFIYLIYRFLITFVLMMWDMNKMMLNIIRVSSATKKIDKSKKERESTKETDIWFDHVKVIMTMLIIFTSIFVIQKYGKWVIDIPRYVFIPSEYYENSYCKNLKGNNILVAEINPSRFSVYNVKSKKFSTCDCSKEQCDTEIINVSL